MVVTQRNCVEKDGHEDEYPKPSGVSDMEHKIENCGLLTKPFFCVFDAFVVVQDCSHIAEDVAN